MSSCLAGRSCPIPYSSAVPAALRQGDCEQRAGRVQWNNHGVWADRIWQNVHDDR